LQPLRRIYKESRCNDECKKQILKILGKTDSINNRDLYNRILKNPGIYIDLTNFAAIGLAKTGSMEAIPYLRDMLNYIFEPEPLPEHSVYFIIAVTDSLAAMSSKSYLASKEIQDAITKTCNMNPDKYGVSLKIPENIYDLFIALENDVSEGNRQYMERLLSNPCNYNGAKKWAIEVLGEIGNEGTIAILQKYAGTYPKTVSDAVTEIKKRIKSRKN
jgi:hypothetical protein